MTFTLTRTRDRPVRNSDPAAHKTAIDTLHCWHNLSDHPRRVRQCIFPVHIPIQLVILYPTSAPLPGFDRSRGRGRTSEREGLG